MRFILTIAIWVVFVGGLFLYTSHRSQMSVLAREQVREPVAEQVHRQLTIELTPTFSSEADPFALQTDAPAQSLEISLNGRTLPVESTGISRGKALVIRNAEVSADGVNELFVRASPPMEESGLDHGIRVRLLDGAQTITEQTIWSSGGGLVAGSVSFEFKDGDSGHDH